MSAGNSVRIQGFVTRWPCRRRRTRPRVHDVHEADAEHTHADISKTNELLGYEPTRDIREGVREFIDWYQTNREWYEPLVRQS